MSPKISIVMAIYNDAPTVGKTIESVLNQTFSDFEFIIVDDGSTDESWSVIKGFAQQDKRIRVHKNQRNLGLTRSLNVGLSLSKADLIARIDGDDWWSKEKLQLQYQFLGNNPEYGIVGTNGISHNSISGETIKDTKPETEEGIINLLPWKSPFIHSAIVFKKVLVSKYNERFATSQDYELYSRLLLKVKGYNIQECLTHRLTHEMQSISTGRLKLQKRNNIKIRWQIFKQYKTPLWKIYYFLPDIVILLLPKFLKSWKSRFKYVLNR